MSSIIQTTFLSVCLFLLLVDRGLGLYSLQLHPRLDYEWDVDYDRKVVNVKVTYRPQVSQDEDPKDWIAVGFTESNIGAFNKADFCILWADWKGNIYMEDVHTGDNDGIARVDRYQDCQNFQLDPDSSDSEISFSFTRAFDTCHDNEDYIIEDGTTHVVWSFGKGPLYQLEGLDLTDPDSSTDNGFSRVRLLKVDVPLKVPQDAKTLEVRHQVAIPSDNTTYWCSIHKLPEVFAKKHHVIQYEAVITPGNQRFIHHMEVFHCVPQTDSSEDQIFPLWQGPCGSDEAPEKLQRCKKVLAAWAIGAGPFTYPKETGLPMGGEQFNPYVMLEVHLNNEQEESGVKDGSGLRFLVTESLRTHDAGIMELGLIYTDHMAIPPGQFMFPLHGFCLPACTAVGFPSEGITIFGSQLHTHGSGMEVDTKHFRGGLELPEVNRDNHYSTHFQEIRALRKPRQILPGDELVTSCWYDTRRKTNVTVGGFTFDDEMCLNYIHYYPKTEDLEICKSSVDSKALDTYFQFLNEWDGQSTDSDLTVCENYQTIEWTKLRAEKLRRFYDYAPVEMQCSSGAGTQLPGKWTGMPQPQIRQTLPPEPRPECKRDNQGLQSIRETKRSSLELDQDRFRKRWSNKRKRTLEKKKWIGRQFELKKRSGSDKLPMKKKAEPFISMIKRVGQPMNEMKKRSPSFIGEVKRSGNSMNEMKKKSVALTGYEKQDGIPMNEMKKKSESLITMVKRVGTPMNEMKKKKRYSQDISEEDIVRLENDLDDALDLLDQALAASGDSVNSQRKRRKRIVPVDEQQAQELAEDLENQLSEVRNLLSQLGIQDSDLTNENSLIDQRKKKDDEEADGDYSDEWSDYDSWGIDLTKRGLGSMKKRGPQTGSADISI